MNRKLLIVLAALSLSACASLPVADALPEKALQANVHSAARTRTLPNGREYCYELSETQKELDACTLDLEDLAHARGKQVESIVELVDKYVQRMRESRCKWWQRCKI